MPWPPSAWAVMIPTTVAAVEIVTLSGSLTAAGNDAGSAGTLGLKCPGDTDRVVALSAPTLE